jgi:hypothetical protein
VREALHRHRIAVMDQLGDGIPQGCEYRRQQRYAGGRAPRRVRVKPISSSFTRWPIPG